MWLIVRELVNVVGFEVFVLAMRGVGEAGRAVAERVKPSSEVYWYAMVKTLLPSLFSRVGCLVDSSVMR
jgi:hypothetical protein